MKSKSKKEKIQTCSACDSNDVEYCEKHDEYHCEEHMILGNCY